MNLLLLGLDTRERGAVFLPRYHPGVWRRPGRYSCCDDINRRSIGCQHTADPTNNPTEAPAVNASVSNEPRRFSAFPGIIPPVTSTEMQTPPMPPLGVGIGVSASPQPVGMQAKPIPPVPQPTQVPQSQQAIPGKVLLPSPSPAVSSAPVPNPVNMFAQQQQQQQLLFQQQLLAQQQHNLNMIAAAQPHLQQQQQIAAVASRRPIRLPQSPGGQSFDWVSPPFADVGSCICRLRDI